MRHIITLQVEVNSAAPRERVVESLIARFTQNRGITWALPSEIAVTEVVVEPERPDMTVADLRKHVADAISMLTTEFRGFDPEKPLSMLRNIAGAENIEKSESEMMSYAHDMGLVNADLDVVFTDEDDQTTGAQFTPGDKVRFVRDVTYGEFYDQKQTFPDHIIFPKGAEATVEDDLGYPDPVRSVTIHPQYKPFLYSDVLFGVEPGWIELVEDTQP